MSLRTIFVAVGIVALLGVGAFALGLFSGTEPGLEADGPGTVGAGEAEDADGGAGDVAVTPPPTREAEVSNLLTEPDRKTAKTIVARLAKPGEAKRTAQAIVAMKREEPRARAFLRLLRTEGEEGPDFVRDAARGDYGPELRISAILALAGDPAEEGTTLLAAIAGDPDDPELGAAAMTALGMAGTAQAQAALARVLEQTTDPARRETYIRTIGSSSVALGGDLLADLGRRDGRLVPSDRFPEGAIRIATVLSRERDPKIIPIAGGALARMEGPTVDDAILSLVEASEGEVRRELFDVVASELTPDRGPLVAKMALAASAPDEVESRRRALEALRTSEIGRNGPVDPAILKWAETETDPGLRGELRQFLEER